LERREDTKQKPSYFIFDKYSWSSYPDYLLGNRIENKILDRKNFLNYFSSKKDFQKEIF